MNFLYNYKEQVINIYHIHIECTDYDTLNYRPYCEEIHGQEKFNDNLTKCLQLKEFKKFSATITKDEMGSAGAEEFFNNSMNIQFLLRLASMKRNVYEEVLIIDEIGLVGSLGGSLGLFVGFSFFGYATPLLEAVFNKLADFFQRVNQPY